MQNILASLFAQNDYQLYEEKGCLPQRTINCENARVEGLEWRVPYTVNGRFEGYRTVRQVAKPQPDAVRTLRVRAEGITYWIAVADDTPETIFADKCNQCCEDGTPVIAAPVIPAILLEDYPPDDVDGNKIFNTFLPPIITGQKLLASATFDGVAAPALSSAGYASYAALLAAIQGQATWAAQGTWSLVTVANGTYLKLVAPTLTSSSRNVTLKKQDYCLTNTFPVTFNIVVHNTIVNTLPEDVVAANMTELIAALAPYLADGNITAFSATKMSYNGTGVPGSIKEGATTVASFVAGVCS